MLHSRRVLALCLCLCLLPACAGAVIEPTGHTASDSPVYRSVFTLDIGLRADGFPTGSAHDFSAWEDLLGKMSLRGTIDVQDFLQQFSRVYFDGGVYLNGKNALPFAYDAYYNYRYLRSPALDGASVHFQMYNFFEFMFKPYDYFEFPTHRMALLLYPEISQELGKAYYDPIREALGGEGSRVIPYDTLYELAETLDLIALDDMDHYYRLDNYLRSLLMDLDANDAALEALGCLEDWLDWLDPEGEGMTVTVSADSESYSLGGHELFVKSVRDGYTRFALTLPNADGYTLGFTWDEQPRDEGWDLDAALAITLEGAERARVSLALHGLPKADEMQAAGDATVSFGGEALAASEQRFTFAYRRDAQALPYAVTLDADWLHPQTGLPALTLRYQADMTEHDNTILVDRAVDNQDDFFHLNETYIEEYKERFVPTLALAALPFVLEAPAPVISDVLGFMDETGILLTLGLE